VEGIGGRMNEYAASFLGPLPCPQESHPGWCSLVLARGRAEATWFGNTDIWMHGLSFPYRSSAEVTPLPTYPIVPVGVRQPWRREMVPICRQPQLDVFPSWSKSGGAFLNEQPYPRVHFNALPFLLSPRYVHAKNDRERKRQPDNSMPSVRRYAL
jgi:hypothetical protein